ncbi:hypothetical protein [Serratia symbiotica]
MYALPESCPFTGLFISNPIYSTTPVLVSIMPCVHLKYIEKISYISLLF